MDYGVSPVEIIKKLRSGEKMQCPECKTGVIIPVGDCKTTHGFYCTNCKFSINID